MRWESVCVIICCFRKCMLQCYSYFRKVLLMYHLLSSVWKKFWSEQHQQPATFWIKLCSISTLSFFYYSLASFYVEFMCYVFLQNTFIWKSRKRNTSSVKVRQMGAWTNWTWRPTQGEVKLGVDFYQHSRIHRHISPLPKFSTSAASISKMKWSK